MRIKTHYVVALEAYKILKHHLPITFDERALKIGASMPDLAPHRRFKIHNIKIAAKEWKAFVEWIDRKSATPFLMSYAAGMMSHYISDTFCYAHSSKNVSLREHRSYEVYMNKQTQGFNHNIKIEEIFNQWQRLQKEGIEAYIEVENAKYKEASAKCKTRHEHVLLDLRTAIMHTAVWMLEVVSVLYPAYKEGVAIQYV